MKSYILLCIFRTLCSLGHFSLKFQLFPNSDLTHLPFPQLVYLLCANQDFVIQPALPQNKVAQGIGWETGFPTGLGPWEGDDMAKSQIIQKWTSSFSHFHGLIAGPPPPAISHRPPSPLIPAVCHANPPLHRHPSLLGIPLTSPCFSVFWSPSSSRYSQKLPYYGGQSSLPPRRLEFQGYRLHDFAKLKAPCYVSYPYTPRRTTVRASDIYLLAPAMSKCMFSVPLIEIISPPCP